MKKNLSILACGLLVTASLISCKKEEEQSETVSNSGNSNKPEAVSPDFNYDNASGVLVAVNTRNDVNTPNQTDNVFGDAFGDALGNVQIDFITAVAVFFDETNKDSNLDAGSVTFAGSGLKKFDNNSYLLVNSDQSIDASDAKAWTVEGKGDVPAISYTNTNAYPSVSSFDGEVTITKGEDFTLSYGSVSSADSVLIVIAKDDVYLQKTVAGNVSSATFSADETSTLGSGEMALVQVTPYNLNPQEFDSKDYYFINQTTYSSYSGTVE